MSSLVTQYFNKEEEKVLKNLADKLSRHHTVRSGGLSI